MPITKRARFLAIKELISTSTVGSQDELRVELKKRGFDVTQATLSRDLRDLGIGRVTAGGAVHYVLQPAAEAEILKPIVGTQVVSVRANEGMIVIHTLPGCANVVAEFLDTLGSTDIIGTLAGDNTLLVIPASQRKTANIERFIRNALTEGNAA